MPLYVVDTISMFRMRYVIEADDVSHAKDEVVMRESGNDRDYFDEFSQEHLGETIVDGREITYEEYKRLLKSDAGCSYWMGDRLIHKIQYNDTTPDSGDYT